MKKRKLFGIAAAFAAAVFLAACSNISSPKADSKNGAATICVRLSGVERTALPNAQVSDLKNFKLFYKSGGESAPLGETYANYDALASANLEFSAGAGTYEFILQASCSGVSLSGSVTKQIKAGERNELSFLLKQTGYDLSAGGTGSVSIDFSVAEKNGASYAEMHLYEMGEDGSLGEEVSGKNSFSSEISSFSYSQSEVASGRYVLKVSFYENEQKQTLVNEWLEAVIVVNGLASSESVSISALNEVYSIDYDCNGGAIKSLVCARSYSKESRVILPLPVRSGFEFAGWYLSANFSGSAVTGWSEYERTGNVKFYAKWEELAADDTLVLTGEYSSGSDYNNYLVDLSVPAVISKGDVVKLSFKASGVANAFSVIGGWSNWVTSSENAYGTYVWIGNIKEDGSQYSATLAADKNYLSFDIQLQFAAKSLSDTEEHQIALSDVSVEVLGAASTLLTSTKQDLQVSGTGEIAKYVDYDINASAGDSLRLYVKLASSGGKIDYCKVNSSDQEGSGGTGEYLGGIYAFPFADDAEKYLDFEADADYFEKIPLKLLFGEPGESVSFAASTYLVNMSKTGSSGGESISYDYDNNANYPAISAAPAFTPNFDTLKTGWNLGNCLDSHSDFTPSEGSWSGGIRASQALMDGVAAAGFKTVRIPVTWGKMIGGEESNYKINSAYLERVAQVVGYAHNAGLIAIINLHHDGADNIGWLNINNCKGGSTETSAGAAELAITKKLYYVWRQIAQYFVENAAGSEDYLMFETMNEIHDGNWGNSTDATQYAILNRWNQTAVNAIRWGGAGHYVIVPGYVTNIDKTCDGFAKPDDKLGRLILTVHYYDPSNFTLEATSTWAGAGWGDQAYMTEQFRKIKAFSDSRNLAACFIGECGATYNKNAQERTSYNVAVINTAMSFGLVPIFWDNGSGYGASGKECSGLFNRSNGKVYDYNESMLRAMAAAAGTTYSAQSSGN